MDCEGGKGTGKGSTMEKVRGTASFMWRFEEMRGMADAADEDFGS